MSRRPESVLVLITCAEQILLFERADWPGFWQSVTGSLETGESPAEAARRELSEETGFSAEPVDLHLTHEFEIAPGRRLQWAPGIRVNREHGFHLALQAPESPRACAEHARWGWFPLSTARWLISSWSNRAVLAQVCA